MSFKVYAGESQASRTYELKFFREFAGILAAQFEEEGRDGVLLGHPLSKDDKYFKPDVLLITARSVVIIDFKNESGATIKLPSESAFGSAKWESRVGDTVHTVMGGNSANPFAQLQKQSGRMAAVLREVGVDIPVQLCVLFQGDVQLEGRVPGKFQRFFSIATGFDYPNVVNDMINLESRDGVLKDLDSLRSRFEVKKFQDYSLDSDASLANARGLAEISQEKQRLVAVRTATELQVRDAEGLFREAERRGESLVEAEKRVELARADAEKATVQAEFIVKQFDEKRHEVELSREKTEQMKAAAHRQQSKTWLAVVLSAATLVVLTLGIIFLFVPQQQQAEQEAANQAEQLAEQQAAEAKDASQLLADQEAGRACIPAGQASDFVGLNDVCVTFTVRHIGESGNGFVFIQEQNRGSFTALVMNNSIISAQEAEDAYEGRQVEVRGDMTDYKGTTQIEIYDPSQITVVN
jgi:hypothetical protein